jgi:hypothetical protein
MNIKKRGARISFPPRFPVKIQRLKSSISIPFLAHAEKTEEPDLVCRREGKKKDATAYSKQNYTEDH